MVEGEGRDKMTTIDRKKLIELIESDPELRYTLAGMLGLIEILQKLEKILIAVFTLQEQLVRISEHVSILVNMFKDQVDVLREQSRTLSEHASILRQQINVLKEHLDSIRELMEDLLGRRPGAERRDLKKLIPELGLSY